MDRRTSILIGILIIVVAGGALIFGLNQNQAASEACNNAHTTTYQVSIENNHVSNANLQAHLCNRLTFTNKDSIERAIAFGEHDHHSPYDGVTERFLSQNESFTITLNSLGTYHWHDHIHDEIEGNFTVLK